MASWTSWGRAPGASTGNGQTGASGQTRCVGVGASGTLSAAVARARKLNTLRPQPTHDAGLAHSLVGWRHHRANARIVCAHPTATRCARRTICLHCGCSMVNRMIFESAPTVWAPCTARTLQRRGPAHAGGSCTARALQRWREGTCTPHDAAASNDHADHDHFMNTTVAKRWPIADGFRRGTIRHTRGKYIVPQCCYQHVHCTCAFATHCALHGCTLPVWVPCGCALACRARVAWGCDRRLAQRPVTAFWCLTHGCPPPPTPHPHMPTTQDAIKTKSYEDRIFFLFQPFTQTVWLVLLLAIFLHGLVTWSIERDSVGKKVAAAKMNVAQAENRHRDSLLFRSAQPQAVERGAVTTTDAAADVERNQGYLQQDKRKMDELGRESIYHSCKCATTNTTMCRAGFSFAPVFFSHRVRVNVRVRARARAWLGHVPASASCASISNDRDHVHQHAPWDHAG